MNKDGSLLLEHEMGGQVNIALLAPQDDGQDMMILSYPAECSLNLEREYTLWGK